MNTGTVTTSEPAPSAATGGLAEALSQPGSAELLQVVLAAVFPNRGPRTGRRRFEQIDLVVASAAFAVSTGTVRRWLRATGGRPALPRTRAIQLAQMAGPSPDTRRREQLDIGWAESALARLQLGRGRGRAAMEEQYGDTGRLEPHIVAVLELPKTGLSKVVTTRASYDTVARARRAGELIDFTSVPLPNWWAAELVRHALLRHVDPWRVEAAIRIRQKGHTQTWVTQAPLPALDALARTSGEDQ